MIRDDKNCRFSLLYIRDDKNTIYLIPCILYMIRDDIIYYIYVYILDF